MIKEEHFKQETQEEVKRKGDMSLFQESEVDLGPHIKESDSYSLLLLHFVMCLYSSLSCAEKMHYCVSGSSYINYGIASEPHTDF